MYSFFSFYHLLLCGAFRLYSSTTIRDNLGFRIALGQNDRTTLQTIFGKSVEILKKKVRPGNG